MKTSHTKGFTLIELLVVISIIALISSVVSAAVSTSRKKARDSIRIQNARQIAIALEQYESSNNSYKVANSGLGSSGSGFVLKSGSDGYTNSILSTLKSAGYMSSADIKDPVFGSDNYYLGVCTSTNAYNVFVKMEQDIYNAATSSISTTCGGAEAANLGFNFIASTAGGSSGGGGGTSGYSGASDPVVSCGSYSVTGQDGLTYGTVAALDGKCWLDRNLGATRVATAANDYQSYGDLYQWGRRRDGHELINHTSASAATAVNGSTAATSSTDTPPNSLFIVNTSSPFDWRIPQNGGLWQGVNGTNNVCPAGFRLPTQTEFTNLVAAEGITNNTTAFASRLKLPQSGARNYNDATFGNMGSNGYYWTSSSGGIGSDYVYIYASDKYIGSTYRAYGFAIRCVKN